MNEIQKQIKTVARKTKIAPAKYEKAPNKQMKEEDETFKIVKAIQRNKIYISNPPATRN